MANIHFNRDSKFHDWNRLNEICENKVSWIKPACGTLSPNVHIIGSFKMYHVIQVIGSWLSALNILMVLK